MRANNSRHGALTQTGHDNVATEGRFLTTTGPFLLKFDMVLGTDVGKTTKLE